MSYLVKELRDQDGWFWLEVSWFENSFSLTLVKGKNAYTATITCDYLEKQSRSLKQDFVQYCRNLKEYIEEENDNVNIGFKETQKVLEVNFIISVGSSVKYFSVELTDSDFYESVRSIIDKLNTRSTEALLQLKIIQEQNASLKNELTSYTLKLQDFVKAKKLSDEEMLSNFLVLLNEKKSKIQYLTELLDAFNNGRETRNAPVKRKQSKRTKSGENSNEVDIKRAKREMISDSESDENAEEPMEEDYDTEEEKRKRLDNALAVPSTSKADYGFLKEDTPPREIQRLIKPIVNRTADSNFLVASHEEERNETCNMQNENVEISSPILKFNTQDMLDEL